jgi:hypothetical protein
LLALAHLQQFSSVLTIPDMIDQLPVVDTPNGYFPFMIVHVERGHLQHPQLCEWLPIQSLTLVLLIPTSSDGPSRQSHIYFTHAQWTNSGYIGDVIP